MGKGAFFVAEQFGFQQFLGNCAAIYGHKGLVGPLAVGVQGAHQKLLASAGFPGHQNSAVRWRDFAEDPENFRKRCTLAYYAAGIKIHLQVVRTAGQSVNGLT